MTPGLSDAISGLGLALTEAQAAQLAHYRDLLAVSANEFNLTSLRDPESIERRHIVESLAFGALLRDHGLLLDRTRGDAAAGNSRLSVVGRGPDPTRGGRRGPIEGHGTPGVGLSVLDIGTGAGLPGIPLKIAWPEVRLTLLESVGKKCRFLEHARDVLGLEDVDVVEARAEDFGRDQERRERYDLAVARAVAPLAVLLEYALPALRAGGRLAAVKGSGARRELDAAAGALEALGGRVLDALPFEPPGGARQTVILVEKAASTPERFPRRAGMPSKRPL